MSNRIIQSYDYSSPLNVIEHRDLTVIASMVGTYSEGEKQGRYHVTVRKNPYAILVLVKTVSFYYRSAKITHLRIEDAHGRTVPAPRGIHLPRSDFFESPDGYTAELSVPGFRLSHETYRLNLSLQIHTRANAIENYDLVLLFSPHYREEKTNDTWGKANDNQ